MIGGAFDEFFGVPTHPLAVHAPVVLVPIAAVVAVVLAVRNDWRQRVAWLMPAAVFVLVAMLFVARESGEAVAEADNVFGDITEHQDLADTTFVLSIVWFSLTVAVAVRDRMVSRDSAATALSADVVATSPRDTIATMLAVVAALAAVVTTIWLVRTGHAGAESRWKLD